MNLFPDKNKISGLALEMDAPPVFQTSLGMSAFYKERL